MVQIWLIVNLEAGKHPRSSSCIAFHSLSLQSSSSYVSLSTLNNCMEQDLLKQCYRDEFYVGKLLWCVSWKLLSKGKILYCITSSMYHRHFGMKVNCKQGHQTNNLCRPFSTLSTLFRICSVCAFGTAEFQEQFKIALRLHSRHLLHYRVS